MLADIYIELSNRNVCLTSGVTPNGSSASYGFFPGWCETRTSSPEVSNIRISSLTGINTMSITGELIAYLPGKARLLQNESCHIRAVNAIKDDSVVGILVR